VVQSKPKLMNPRKIPFRMVDFSTPSEAQRYMKHV